MPAAIAVPAIMSAVGTGAALYSSKKARDAAKLDPQTLAYQNQALKLKNQRMEMMAPLYQQLAAGMSNRLAGAAPSIGQMRTPGTGQAISRLAQGLPGPAARRRRTQDQA